MNYWLLEPGVKEHIERALASGNGPTAQEQADYSARMLSQDDGGSGLLTVAGNVAQLNIEGAITKRPSLMALIFGGGNVTYNAINQALADAEQDPDVERIELSIDSPGGHVDGLFDTVAALQSCTKPLKTVVRNTAASAAYALAAQAGTIVASNKAARVGSLGVVASFYHDPDVIEITSRDAPNKRPDITTDEGKATVRDELDALHELFAEAIADGRGETVKNINANYGRGGTFVASEALSRGMIDGIETISVKPKTSTEIKSMDLNTLRAQHPDVYAAALEIGADTERDRVSAHLTAGTQSGLMDVAVKAIEDGTAMTSALQTKYIMAAANRGDQSARGADDADLEGADNADAPDLEGKGQAGDVATLVENAMGVSADA